MLNGLSDDIDGLFEEIGEYRIDVQTPGPGLLGGIETDAIALDGHVTSMGLAIDSGVQGDFQTARMDYTETWQNLGARVNQLIAKSTDLRAKAAEALDASQGDQFRIKGIYTDLRLLDARLGQVAGTLFDLTAALNGIRARLAAPGSPITGELEHIDGLISSQGALFFALQDEREEVQGLL